VHARKARRVAQLRHEKRRAPARADDGEEKILEEGGAQAGAPPLVERGVTEHSNALDLERGVFAQKSSRAIALSLRRSAQRSTRRKSDP